MACSWLILVLSLLQQVKSDGYQNYEIKFVDDNQALKRPTEISMPSQIASNGKTTTVILGTKVQQIGTANNVGHVRREQLHEPLRSAEPVTEKAEDRSLATLTALSLVSSAIVIFAPASSVWRVMADKACEEELVGLAPPYYFLFAQSYFWALFGMEAGNAEIAYINIFGTCTCVIYLIVLAAFGGGPEERQKSNRYCRPASKGFLAQTGMTVRLLLGYAVLACGIISSIELSVDDAPLRSELLAYTACIFNIGVFLYPLRQCADAIRRGSTVGFPVALSVAGFVSCALWAQYSALTHNFEYLIPNCMGLLCNGCQICVVGWIYIFRNTGKDDFLKFDARFSDNKGVSSQDPTRETLLATGGSGEQATFKECIET